MHKMGVWPTREYARCSGYVRMHRADLILPLLHRCVCSPAAETDGSRMFASFISTTPSRASAQLDPSLGPGTEDIGVIGRSVFKQGLREKRTGEDIV